MKQTVKRPTAVTNLVFNGYEQTGVPYDEGGEDLYVLSLNKGINAGNYEANATLLDPRNYQ